MAFFTRRPLSRGLASSPALAALLALISLAGVPTTAGADAAPQNDDEKAFYSIGAGLSQQFDSIKPIGEREIEVLVQGLRDGIEGKTLAVEQQEGAQLVRSLIQARQGAAAEAEKKASTDFAAAEANKPGAKKTESGLIYTAIKEGTGEFPTATNTVSVHYHGTLRDGTVFDSSVERGEPAEFPLNRVIPCWTEGVAMMKAGGKSRLVCPSEIAYGDRSTGRIPGGATLIFEVELLEIVK